MTKKLKEAIARVEAELVVHNTITMGTSFAMFLNDLQLIVAYAKKKAKGKRRG